MSLTRTLFGYGILLWWFARIDTSRSGYHEFAPNDSLVGAVYFAIIAPLFSSALEP